MYIGHAPFNCTQETSVRLDAQATHQNCNLYQLGISPVNFSQLGII